MAGLGYPYPAGAFSMLGITAPTVVKVGKAVVFNIVEIVDGTGTGGIYDGVSITGNTTANQIATIPGTGNQLDNLSLPFPVMQGIVVIPGTGQTLAISWT